MKRRIVCDKSLPTCHKCAKKDLVCPGYGIRYRFANSPSTPLAAASSSQASSSVAPASSSTQRAASASPRGSPGPSFQGSPQHQQQQANKVRKDTPLKWVEASARGRQQRRSTAAAAKGSGKFGVPLLDAAVETIAPDAPDSGSSRASSVELSGLAERLAVRTSPLENPWRAADAQVPEGLEIALSLPALLAPHDDRVRYLFEHCEFFLFFSFQFYSILMWPLSDQAVLIDSYLTLAC